MILGFEETISSQRDIVPDVKILIPKNLVKKKAESVTLVEEMTTWLETIPRDPCALFASRLVIYLGTARKGEKIINLRRTREAENHSGVMCSV